MQGGEGHMIEENWKDVTLYNVHAIDGVNEHIGSFLFYSELEKNEIIKILINYYENKFKKEHITIDELDDGIQLIK